MRPSNAGANAGATLIAMSVEAHCAMPPSQRDAPPYFAGRLDELAALNKRLDYMLDMGESIGGLALIVGVPGVGKTQLGRKFAQDVARRESGAGVPHLMLSTEMLESSVDLFLAIGDVLDRDDEFRQVAGMDSKVVGRAGGISSVASAKVAWEHIRHTGGLFAMLRQSKSDGCWNGKSLVIVIDELQTVSSAGLKNLRVLHEGLHGCPILTVGIGLQHTPNVLSPADGSPGISRVDEPINLHCLCERESLEAICESMAVLKREIPEERAVDLAKASYGFPQHIHGYLKGAVEAADKHGGLETEASLKYALMVGDKARADYYDARLSQLGPSGQLAMLPVIEVMLDKRFDSLDWSVVVEAVNDASFDGEKIIGQAVAHGVLTLSKDGVSFGIPSFHNHMVQWYRERQRRSQQ